jgi:hypothetical protein
MNPVGLVTFSSVVLPILESRSIRLSPEEEERTCAILRSELESICIKNQNILHMIPNTSHTPSFQAIKDKAIAQLRDVRSILSAMEIGGALLNPSQVEILTEAVESLADKHFERGSVRYAKKASWRFSSPEHLPSKVAYEDEIMKRAQGLRGVIHSLVRSGRKEELGLLDEELRGLDAVLSKILNGDKISFDQMQFYDRIVDHFKQIGFRF